MGALSPEVPSGHIEAVADLLDHFIRILEKNPAETRIT
jgi:hypothetical protein